MPEGQVKIEKEMSPESTLMTHESSEGDYPYGTCLNFRDEMIDKLGIGEFSVGDVVEIRGYAVIEGKMTNEDMDDKTRKSVEVQMTSVSITKKPGDKAEQLYGEQS